MDFMSEECEVVYAAMNNYAGDIEIAGVDKDGAQITITVEMKKEEKHK